MKKYLAIYIGSVSAAEKATQPLSGQKQAEGMQAWGKWVGDNQNAIVDQGAPLGKTKRVSESGIEDFENKMTAYVIVEAESHQTAAKMFENHPHFSIFPGDSVEIMECVDIPAP